MTVKHDIINLKSKGETMAKTAENMTPQEICINNHDGMYLVVAGPGVGKTYTIVKRIQSMIDII